MKKIIEKIKTSIWLYPAVYSLFSLTLAISISIIHKLYADEISNHISGLFFTAPPMAQTILSIVAGAFITIATFTFSTTMVVLTMYSTQFTPRVVENFLDNIVMMKSFGVFLSGFIYAITALLLINTNTDDNLLIVASVGVIYVIVGLVYFILFIHSVSTHIQASDLLLRLQKEASKKIKQYSDSVKQSHVISEIEMQKICNNKNHIDVLSQSDGYIQEINYLKLCQIAHDYNCIACFKKVVGQFIAIDTRIVTVYYEDSKRIDETLVHEIQKCVQIGNKRTEMQDFSFSIQKIVEIALKALSPGINDPNTAVHCLKIIGVLLRDIADLEKGYVVLKEKKERGIIIYEAYDFEILLYDAYNQIIFFGQSDAAVVIALFKSLRYITAKSSENNTHIITKYANSLFEKLTINGFDSLEYSKISKEYSELAHYSVM